MRNHLPLELHGNENKMSSHFGGAQGVETTPQRGRGSFVVIY